MKARRNLASLRDRSFRYEVLGGTTKRPDLVSIQPMDRKSYWRRVDNSWPDPLFEETDGPKDADST